MHQNKRQSIIQENDFGFDQIKAMYGKPYKIWNFRAATTFKHAYRMIPSLNDHKVGLLEFRSCFLYNEMLGSPNWYTTKAHSSSHNFPHYRFSFIHWHSPSPSCMLMYTPIHSNSKGSVVLNWGTVKAPGTGSQICSLLFGFFHQKKASFFPCTCTFLVPTYS